MREITNPETASSPATKIEATNSAHVDTGTNPSPTSTFHDVSEPRDFPRYRKWIYVTIVGYCECLTFLVSMMLAPSIPRVLSEFRPDGSDRHLGSLSITIYILGFCVGPLILAPLSDLYGRVVIYRIYILIFVIFTFSCALAPTIEALIVFRFFAGCVGGAPMSLGGAVVADLYPPGARDGPLAFYTVGVLAGPTLGPVFGGIITGTLGWRWVFWIATILAGAAAVAIFGVLPETHLPTLQKRHNRADETRGHFAKRFCSLNTGKLFRTVRRAVFLPAKLSGHMTVSSTLLFMCVFNGLVNMILSSLGSVYQTQYNFPETTAGLPYLAIGIGGLGALAQTKTWKRHLNTWLTERNIARGLQTTVIFIIVVIPTTSIGLLLYGWPLEYYVHWIVPIIGLLFFGFGYMATRLSTQILLLEAVPRYSASALAAHTVASSVGGAILPIAIFPLYEAVGYGWGNTVISTTNLVLCVVPLSLAIASRSGKSLEIDVEYDVAAS